MVAFHVLDKLLPVYKIISRIKKRVLSNFESTAVAELRFGDFFKPIPYSGTTTLRQRATVFPAHVSTSRHFLHKRLFFFNLCFVTTHYH